MAVPFNAAASAYNSAARLLGQGTRPAVDQVANAVNTPDFGQMLTQAVQGVVETGNAADAQAMSVVNGKGDMVDVVTAISQTQLAMETMVTVRDKVIAAYEEIMRMPI